MYGQVCNIGVQKQIEDGLKLPKTISNKFKYISQNWMEPISYKQFSNMLLQKNKIYNEMVRRNGQEDPLRKTLLIIDEAHKIYSPTVAKSEKPDTQILEQMIQESYAKSGKDSVRIMLMTATPFTEDAMEMIQLLNLLKENDKIASNFDEFASEYLNDAGYFTKKGLQKFQDKVSGYISYLNRSQDARNFAHPVIENIHVPMSTTIDNDEKPKNKYDVMSRDLREQSKALRTDLQNLKKSQKETKLDKAEIKQCIDRAKAEFDRQNADAKTGKKAEEDKCKELPVKQRKTCKEDIIQKYKDIIENLKAEKERAIAACKQLKHPDAIENIHEQINDITKQIAEYRKRLAEYNDIKKGRRGNVKQIREQIKEIRQNLKQNTTEFKELQANVKDEMKALKKIGDKNQRLASIKEFRKDNPLLARIKELKKEIKHDRLNISKNNIKIKNMQIEDGSAKLKNISQRYTLAKYCSV